MASSVCYGSTLDKIRIDFAEYNIIKVFLLFLNPVIEDYNHLALKYANLRSRD
jgi:hypothetical protein